MHNIYEYIKTNIIDDITLIVPLKSTVIKKGKNIFKINLYKFIFLYDAGAANGILLFGFQSIKIDKKSNMKKINIISVMKEIIRWAKNKSW